MKGFFVKLLAVLLAAALLAGMALPCVSAADGAADIAPVIFIHGESTIVRDNGDGTSTALFDDGEYVSQILDGAAPLIAKGFLTGDWQPYADHVLSVLEPAFKDYTPSPDGVIPENTRPVNGRSDPSAVRSGPDRSAFEICYEYFPDTRLSPFDAAAALKEYVDEVKAANGSEKVSIVGRCQGGAYALAYVRLYERPDDYKGLESFILTDPTLYGAHYIEAIFGGSIYIDPEDAAAFLRSYDLSALAGQQFAGALDALVATLNGTYGIELTASAVQRMYDGLREPLFSPLLRQYYARVLGNWSAVYNNFSEALDYVFPTDELKEEFSVIIEKAAAFNELAADTGSIVREMTDAGVLFADLVEYGFPMYPLSTEADEVGDYLTSVRYKSFGAVGSKRTGTLPEEYIAKRTEAGFGAYISPDMQIDASRGLFPDNTWYIKNVNHDLPDQLFRLFVDLIKDDIRSVNDSAAYPQFLNYDPDLPTFVPAREVNDNDYADDLSFLEEIKAGVVMPSIGDIGLFPDIFGGNGTAEPGDADGDGKLTAADARLALRISADLEKADERAKLASDVNGDGRVTAADARMILRVSASLDIGF